MWLAEQVIEDDVLRRVAVKRMREGVVRGKGLFHDDLFPG